MLSLVLGSGSPRRAELLTQVGLQFQIESPAIDETIQPQENPISYVERMSTTKLAAILEKHGANEQIVVLCADTIVVHNNVILGKPASDTESVEMLQALSGGSHRVLTSVSVGDMTGQTKSSCIETVVEFRTLTDAEIGAYCLLGEGRDKAGSYAIQGLGAIFVSAIHGSYSNVVGLPLMESVSILNEFGINTLIDK
jgi:septum formation protein